MRLPSLAAALIPALLVVAAPAVAGIQLVEMKNGKLYEAREALVAGGQMRISLSTSILL